MTISHSKYKVLDLFSGIGGFSLGLERTGGFITTAFCEICPKARQVLNKHWANVKQYTDIRELTNERLKADGIGVDVITGGFPCQDISVAGKKKGIIGERSGLWSEMFRLVADVRPRWVIAENVSALRSKGLTLVLQDFSSLGYSVEWHCLPASAIGAPHQRDRIWIVAHPICQFFRGSIQRQKSSKESSSKKGWGEVWSESIADCETQRSKSIWAVEPNVGRVAHGIPKRVDRLKQLGNSVVPQIPELIGNAILEVGA
jgi:DNA (cytosine-5)-methyltransferase 1